MKRFLLLVLLVGAGRLAAAQAPATDVILRTDGSEVPGRVLTITPTEISYLPVASGTDTLRLPSAQVFLVRYANGTREVLHPLPPAVPDNPNDLLPGLSADQRRGLARQAAAHAYTDRTPFWATLGATLYSGPLLGLAVPAILSPVKVNVNHLHPPRPELMGDPAYGDAYRQEAQRRKRGRAWGGYAVGAGFWVVALGIAVGGLH